VFFANSLISCFFFFVIYMSWGQLFSIFGLGALGYLLLNFHRIVQRLVFLPPQCSYTEILPMPVIWLKTKSGVSIPCYYYKSNRFQGGRGKYTILYSHPNAVDIGVMHPFLQQLQATLGFVDILHYEYPGYGLAKSRRKRGRMSMTAHDDGGGGDDGMNNNNHDDNNFISPNEELCVEAIEAAYKFLLEQAGVKQEEIVLYGTSVGTGPTTTLASSYGGFAGVILEAPFTSCISCVIESLPTFLYEYWDVFQNIKRIGAVRSPTFLIHGDQDEIVPFRHSLRLFQKIPEQYRMDPAWINGAHHNDIIMTLGWTKYSSLFKDFFQKLEKKNQTNS